MDQFLTQIKTMVQQDLQDSVDYLAQNNWSMSIVTLEKSYGRMSLLEDDELKYEILYHLMSAYLNSDYAHRNSRVEECYQEISRLKVINYSLQPEILRLRGIALVRQGRYDEGVQVFVQLAQLSRGRAILQAWAYLSQIYLFQHQFTAKKTLNLARHYSFRILDECVHKPFLRREKSWVLEQLGRIFFQEKNYAEALPYFREKLELTEEPQKRFWIYLDMAEVFLALEQTSRGFQYLKEAEGFFKRQNDLPGLAQAYYVRAKYLLHEGQTELSMELFRAAIDLFFMAKESAHFARTVLELEQILEKKDEKNDKSERGDKADKTDKHDKYRLLQDIKLLYQADLFPEINF